MRFGIWGSLRRRSSRTSRSSAATATQSSRRWRVRTDHPSGRSYRAEGVLESMARALPAGGATTWLRRRLRPVFNRLLAGRAGGLRSILPGGETFVVSPEYRHVTWNPEEYAAFRGAVRPGDVVLDVGANVGAYSVLFGQWTEPGGRVFAFEPDPGAFAGLVKHIELNAMSQRVTAVHAAATDGSAP